MLRIAFDHGLDGKVEISVGSEVGLFRFCIECSLTPLVVAQMELGGTSCDFYCPVFSHVHEAISREKGFIAVEARTTVELDQV